MGFSPRPGAALLARTRGGQLDKAWRWRCYRGAPMPPLYDLMLILDPHVPDERRATIVSEVQAMISAAGTLVGAHDWGTRRLAYEIDHRSDAAYHVFQFEAGSDLLESLNHNLKIADGVLRFRTIRLKPGSPPPPSPRSEPSSRRRDEEPRSNGESARVEEPLAKEEALVEEPLANEEALVEEPLAKEEALVEEPTNAEAAPADEPEANREAARGGDVAPAESA